MFKILTFKKINIKISLSVLFKELLYKKVLPSIIVNTKLNSYTVLEAWANIFGERIKTDYEKNKIKYISDFFKILTHSPSESVLNDQGLCIITGKRHREFLLKTQQPYTLNNGQELVLLNLSKICYPCLKGQNKSIYILKKDEYFDLINTIFAN